MRAVRTDASVTSTRSKCGCTVKTFTPPITAASASFPPRIIFIWESKRVNVLRDVSRRKRSEEHTSELQSRFELVCRLLLVKKNEGVLQSPHLLILPMIF